MPRPSLRWSQVKVGAVVVIAIVLLAAAIMNMNHGLTFISRQVQLKALVNHSQGLKVGGPVRFNGVDVGNVRDIRLAENSGGVDIFFTVHRSVMPHLHDDATVAIKALGLLGDKFLDLSPGTADHPPLTATHTLVGKADGDVTGLASEAGVTLDRLNEAIGDLHRILASISQGQGTAGKLVADPSLYERSQRLLEKLEAASEKGLEVIDKVERGEGTIGRLVADEAFYRRADQALTELTELTRRLSNQNGTLVKLSDPALYQRLDNLTTRGEQILSRIQSGEGTVGKLVTQDELYGRADKLLTELEQLVADVKRHPTKYFRLSLF